MKAILFFSFFFSAKAVLAFPQMIRHGYTNCMTCHTSPRGGGLMTDYGRALSGEVLSTWSYEGEQNWHYGALKKAPNWLKIGGDFRSAQVHSKTDQATIGRFIEMQEQIEVAAKLKDTLINITYSSDTLKESKPWYISQFYILSQLTDKLNIRLGRFIPRFGINTPEHIFSTRGPLGFGYQSERDTAEITFVENKWDFSLALTTGELRDTTDASGIYSQVNYSFGSHDKLGISLEKKSRSNEETSIGIHGLVGLSEHLYLISDTVFRNSRIANSSDTRGLFHFTKVGYELKKGFHLIAIGDLKKTNLSLNNHTESMYGLGFTFFPRPHFEFQGVIAKRRALARSPNEGDYVWLMMHYYL